MLKNKIIRIAAWVTLVSFVSFELGYAQGIPVTQILNSDVPPEKKADNTIEPVPNRNDTFLPSGSLDFLGNTNPISLPEPEIPVQKTSRTLSEVVQEPVRASETIFEAESMQTEGGAWNGGNYQTIWGDGKLKKNYQIQESGIYEIEVMALGIDAGQQPPPKMRVMVDGVMAGKAIPVLNDNWNYKSYLVSGLKLTPGAHEISLGVYTSLAGQYLGIDKMIIRKTGSIANESVRTSIEAVQMQASGGIWQDGDHVGLWGDGELHLSQNITESGIYQIEVVAVGDDGGLSLAPSLRVMADGVMAGNEIEVKNSNWNYQGHESGQIELSAGMHDLRIGVYSKLANQFLGVKRIILRKVAEIAYESVKKSVDAVSLQASGGVWQGGDTVGLWGDGELHLAQNIAESGIYEIEVVAVGDDGGLKPPPALRVMADGVMVGGEVEVKNSNWNYEGHESGQIELSAGMHDLRIGVYSKLANQFLGVKRIILRKAAEIAYESLKTSVDAVSLQASGGVWEGGDTVGLWGDGELHLSQNITESGIYEIEVVAVGDDGGLKPPPSLRVMADGVMVGDEVEVKNSNWNYEGHESGQIELSVGMHDLRIGVYSKLANQFLGVKRIILRKVVDLPYYEPATTTVGALQMQASGATWSSGEYIALWGDGELSQTQNITESGIYEMEIIAVGSDGGLSPAPSFRVMADGVMVGDEVKIENSNWNFKEYTSGPMELSAGMHDLRIGVYSKLDGQLLGVKGIILRKVADIQPVATVGALQMKASGATWSSGEYVALWGDGELSQAQNITKSGIYEMEIIAVGSDGELSPAPSFRIMSDGVMVGDEVKIKNSNWNYKVYQSGPIELTAGMHDLRIGVYSKLANQFLGVKGIILRKVADFPYYEPAAAAVGALQMHASGATWSSGEYISLWGDGALHQAQNIAEPGTYEMEIIAVGHDGGLSPVPSLRVTVDGVMAGGEVKIGNSNWNYKDYKTQPFKLSAGMHDLRIGVDSRQTGQYLGVKGIILKKVKDAAAPVVVFTSTATTVNSDYTLQYTVDGMAHQENWHLAPGANTLIIEAGNSSAPYFFSYQVNNSNAPLIPLTTQLIQMPYILHPEAVSNTATDQPVHFNLDLTQMQTASNQKLSDLLGGDSAELWQPQFDDQGQLTDGILKFQDDRVLQILRGKIRQILEPSGELSLYSATGELENRMDSSGISSTMTTRLDSFTTRVASASVMSSAGGTAFYDAQGSLRRATNSGETIVYDGGMLKQIKTAAGVLLNFQITAISGGFETRLENSSGDTSTKPILLRYDANKQLIHLESSNGSKFDFQNGILTQAVDAAGNQTQYTYDNSPLGDFIGFHVNRAGVRRIYDEQGRLSQIITADGVSATVANHTIAKLDLGGGTVATDLHFDSIGNIAETKVTHSDGSISHYLNGTLADMALPDHSLVTFVNGKASQLKTGDGRTYRYVYALDASGHETDQALRADLISYTSGAGNTLTVTDGSLTGFSLTSNNPFDQFSGGTALQGTSTFIPLLKTPSNLIRNLKLDANGKMIDAEILNHNGDQYFILGGKLDRIITINGKVLTFTDQSVPPVPPAAIPLTADETAYKNQLAEQSLQYFKSGQGVDAATGLPYDDLKEDGTPERRTQPTAIGFYLQILGAVLDGSYASGTMSKQDALNAAQKAIGSLLTMQSQISWKGLVPFANLGTPFTRYGNEIGFGDNANLAQSLAVFIGSVENAKINPQLNLAGLNALISQAESFISNQGQGFTSFYDSGLGLFRSSYNAALGVFSGANDRLMNEFRTGTAFVITRFNLPQKAWDSLVTATRYYSDQNFNSVLNAVPFDGSAFQMFWPLLRAGEELNPEMKAAAWNFLYSLADYAAKNHLPGFPSASFDPSTNDYQGKLGVPDLAETRDALNSRTVSVYALASAYALAPQLVLSWLKAIQTQYPALLGPYGFYDSLALPAANTIGSAVVGKRIYAIDQASFLLGLFNNASADFNKYLDTRGYRNSFDGLYDHLRLNIPPVDQKLPASPFGTGALTTVSAPAEPAKGFHLSGISNAQNGQVNFDYQLSPQGALSDVDVHYDRDGVARNTDLLTYFEQTGNLDEIPYLLNSAPVNLFDQNVEQGAVFTAGQGSAVESKVQDARRGFVKAFDYQQVPGGQPVGYYAKFNDLDLSHVDFLTFSVRRNPGSSGPQSLEVKLEGLGESFIVDSIPENWTRIVLPLKKPNTDLSRVGILIHDQVSKVQSGRVYLGDISLFSMKNYTAGSWQQAVGLNSAQIESLAHNYLTGGNTNTPAQDKTIITNLKLTSDGGIESAQVQSKNGSLLFIQDGQVTKTVTPDGKTILYKNSYADTVTALSGNTAAFSYGRDFKGDIRQVLLSEAGIQRLYTPDGKLQRLILNGLSGGLSQGILTSLRTRFESITDLQGDEFGHIKNAKISLNDGRVLMIQNYKLVQTILLSGTEVSYDGDGYVTSIQSKQGLSEYLYQKDVTGQITRVDVRYTEGGNTVVKNLVPFLREDNRVEEAAILLETPLVNLTEVASNIGAFFTAGRGFVSETKVTDPARNDVLKVDYTIPSNPSFMGIYFRFPNIDLSKYKIMNVALKGAAAGVQPSVTIELKGPGNDRIQLNNLSSTWTDTNVPIDNLNSSIYEATLLINPTQLNSQGTLYLDDISFFNVRKINAQAWQNQLSFNQADLEQFANTVTKAPLVDPTLYQLPVPGFQELKDFNGLPAVLHFDAAGNVVQLTRGDGAVIDVNGNVPINVRLSNGQVIAYQTDTAKNITSATVMDSQTQTASTAQYAYDKARSVTLSDGSQLQYHYEFDAQGNEVTVVINPQTGEIKRFVNGQIQSSNNGGGLVTTYTFDTTGNLKESQLTFRGKANLEVTRYEKSGDKTLITDSSGITWIYDAGGILVQHRTPDGLLYQHTTAADEHGQLQHLIFMIENDAADGTKIYYENGEISRIVFSNGVSFIKPQYDDAHNLSGAQVLYEDGSKVDYTNQFAVKITNLFGDVTAYQLPSGKITLETDSGGKVAFVRIDKDGMTLRYNRDGDLVNLITADNTLYQYIYEEQNGVRTGRMKVYRRQLAQVAGMPVPFPVTVDSDSYGTMHVIINNQLVQTFSNNVQILAINPANGSIDSGITLNMALTGMGQSALDFVNAMPDGEYALVIYPQTSTGYSTDSANFMTALEEIGGSRNKPYMASKPWMLLGQKGVLPGQAYDSFTNYQFNGGTIRLDTEKRDVFYLDANHQIISPAAYGFPSTLLDTTRHGSFIPEVTEVYGMVANGSNMYAADYFKNYNVEYPQSGLYRFLGDFEDRNFIEAPAAYMDAQWSGLADLASGYADKAIYYDERYPVNGISINNLRALKGYFVSKGFQVLNADQLKAWVAAKGPDSIVLMAQDIAPDTIVDMTGKGPQPAKDYLNKGGSFIWLYDAPFYKIGHADNTSEIWNSPGDNYGLRAVFGISVAYETPVAQTVNLYNNIPLASLDPAVLSQSFYLNFDIRELDTWQNIKANFDKNTPVAETDIASIFDQNGTVLGVRKGDGTQNVFTNGKLTSILDRNGVDIIDYFYNAAGELIGSNYIQARQKLIVQIQNAQLQVAQLKTKALMQLASNKVGGVQNIQSQLLAARASLAESRTQVEAQRYVSVCKQCGCSECCEQVENPGYQQAMDNIAAAERQTEADAASALSNVDSSVASANQQINQDQNSAVASILAKQVEVMRSVIQNEITPVLMQFYRLLLGRDPSTAEMNQWLDAAVADPNNRISADVLKAQLLASPERARRLAEISGIKTDVRAFLNQYAAAASDVRVSQAASLGLLGDEIVSLSADDVTKIMTFLDSQNPHFGYSAFLPLQAFLAQNSISVSTRDIAVKAILVDVLTGILNPFSEGDLKISFFALERTAKVFGMAPNGAALTYDELQKIYTDNPGIQLIVHIKGNHYVTLTSVTGDSVSYIESTMGNAKIPGSNAQGEVVTISKAQFQEVWYNPVVNQAGSNQSQMGVALLPDKVQVKPERILDSNTAKLIQGAFCGWDDLIYIVVIAVISGAVQAFTAQSGNFLTNFLKGFAFGAITTVVTAGIGAVLSGFASAVNGIAGSVISGIQSFVAPVVNGFKAIGAATGLSSVFSTVGQFLGGVANWIGQGISAITSFVSPVVKVITSGFSSLGNLFKVAAVGLEKTITGSVLNAAVTMGVNKGLGEVVVNKGMEVLARSFVSGSLIGAANSGGNQSGFSKILSYGFNLATGFVVGGLPGLIVTGLPLLSDALHLPPMLTNILSLTSNILAAGGGNYSTANILKGLGTSISQEFAIAGLTAIGSKIGIAPQVAGLLGSSLFSNFGSILTGQSGSTLNSILSSILNNKTIGAAISIGASIGLNKIGVPSVLSNFLPGLLGQFMSGGGSGGDANSAGQNLFKTITDNISKFGQGIASAVGNAISFGAKVLEGVGSLTVAGFSKAVNFFSGIFDRQTTETLTDNGTKSLETTLNNNCSVLKDGIQCAYKSVDINYLQNENKLSYGNAGTNAVFEGLNKMGEFFGGSVTFANETKDGVTINYQINDGKAKAVDFMQGSKVLYSLQSASSNLINQDGSVNLDGGRFHGAALNAEYIFDSKHGFKINFSPFDASEMSDSVKNAIYEKWGIDESGLNKLDDVIKNQAANNSSYSVNPVLLDDLLTDGAASDFNLLNTLFMAGPLGSVSGQMEDALKSSLVALKTEFYYFKDNLEAKWFDKKPSLDVKRLYRAVFPVTPDGLTVKYFDGTDYVETIMPSTNTTLISPTGYSEWKVEASAVYVNYANKIGVIGGSLLDAVQSEQESFVASKQSDNTIIRDPNFYQNRFQDTGLDAEKVNLAFTALDLLGNAALLKEAFSNGQGLYNIELQSKTYADGRQVQRWVVYTQENATAPRVYLKGAGAEALAKKMLSTVAGDYQDE